MVVAGLAHAAAAVAARAGEKLYVRLLRAVPWRAGSRWSKATRVSPEQIDEDLALLAKYTNCMRTYSVDDGRDDVLKSARAPRA